jgi:WD40 repeat protein
MNFDVKRNLICTSSQDVTTIEFLDIHCVSQKKFQSPRAQHHIYLADREELIYMNNDKKIVIFDIKNEKEICGFPLQHNAKLTKLNYNEIENKLIALTESPDEVKVGWTRLWITIWDLSTEKQQNHFMASAETPDDFCYSIFCMLKLPNFLIAGTYCGRIVLWNLHTQKIAKTIKMDISNPIDQISMDPETNKLYVTQKSCTSVIELPIPTIKL